MPSKHDIIITQRDSLNNNFLERVVSGSNLILQTDSTGVLIGNHKLSNINLANMESKTFKGRMSDGPGVPEDVAITTLKTNLVLVKADVGLSNVDNTTDVDKPISTAQQIAINLKANLESPSFTGIPSGVVALKNATTEVSTSAATAPTAGQVLAATTGTTAVWQDMILSFVHIQGLPSDTWYVTHNLSRFPSVTVIDSAHSVVIADIQYTSDNTLTIFMSAAFSGKAYIN